MFSETGIWAESPQLIRQLGEDPRILLRGAHQLVGISNPQNATCYLAVAIQSLFALPGFRDIILSPLLSHRLGALDAQVSTRSCLKILFALRDAFAHLAASTRSVYDPTPLLDALGLRHDLQEDAGELMKKLQNRVLEALELLESSAGSSDGGSSSSSKASSSSSGKASSSTTGAGRTDGNAILMSNVRYGPRHRRQVSEVTPHPSDTSATAQSSKRAAAPVAEDKPSKRARKAAPASASAAATEGAGGAGSGGGGAAAAVPLSFLFRQLFEGKLRYVTKCGKCKADSEREENFNEIYLSIDGRSDLLDCLRAHFAPANLRGPNQYLCEACNSKQVLPIRRTVSTCLPLHCTFYRHQSRVLYPSMYERISTR
jgi:hypothetical protein